MVVFPLSLIFEHLCTIGTKYFLKRKKVCVRTNSLAQFASASEEHVRMAYVVSIMH